MGKELSINLGLENIWLSRRNFRKGKRATNEILEFEENLEKNLLKLWRDLNTGNYRHGKYRMFSVCDNKKRTISVAPVRDRIVHRLLYNYLVPIFDHTFIYDVWSCRKGKGLIGAIDRTQEFLKKYPRSFIWKADIKKCFDNIDHTILKNLIARKVKCPHAISIISTVIDSYIVTAPIPNPNSNPNPSSISIGNLTSQIFANIYLNELDRYAAHIIHPLAYLRYGDDFLFFCETKDEAEKCRIKVTCFLKTSLRLSVNPRRDNIIHPKQGLKFLGVVLWRNGRRLTKRNRKRIRRRLCIGNVSSYYGLAMHHEPTRRKKEWGWIKIPVPAFPPTSSNQAKKYDLQFYRKKSENPLSL